MTQKINRNEAAAAEVIGFIYIFAIVILSISLIYAMGYPALQSSIDASIFESSEQSFIVLQSDMKMVAFDQMPVKNLKIQLQGSTLSVTNNSNITIKYDDGYWENKTYNTGEIQFQKNDRSLIYENGGVWKQYPDGISIVSNPRIYTDTINGNNTTTIGVVSIRGSSSTGGKGIAVLNMRYNNSEIHSTRKMVNLSLKINSANARKWENYLNSTGFDISSESTDSNVTAWRNNTALIVAQHLVDVEIN